MNRTLLTLIGFPLVVVCVFGLWQIVHQTPNTSYKLVALPPTFHPSANPNNATTTTASTSTRTTTETLPNAPIQNEPSPLVSYLEITTGCTLVVDDTCVKAYHNPDKSSAVKSSLRIGTVLYIKRSLTGTDGTLWYEIDFPEHLRYPERLKLPWYVPGTAGIVHRTAAPKDLSNDTPTTSKRLIVDKSEQTLYAYEGDKLISTTTISTGLELTPTPLGTFKIYRKTPSRYMQGPIPGISTKYYDLPGVPWNLYFTKEGAIVHGAFWHKNFGNPHSNGCVNVDPKIAKEIYDWAELGMTISVQN